MCLERVGCTVCEICERQSVRHVLHDATSEYGNMNSRSTQGDSGLSGPVETGIVERAHKLHNAYYFNRSERSIGGTAVRSTYSFAWKERAVEEVVKEIQIRSSRVQYLYYKHCGYRSHTSTTQSGQCNY